MYLPSQLKIKHTFMVCLKCKYIVIVKNITNMCSNVNNNILLLNFRLFRKRLGLSQAKLAQKIGCSQQKIQSIESGRQNPSPEDLIALAQLGLDIHWLYTGIGKPFHERTGPNEKIKEAIAILNSLLES